MVLVTGATGILGRVIVLELLKQGRKVRATKRASSRLDEVRDSFRFYTSDVDQYFSRIEWIDVDFDDLNILRNILEGVKEVYHCAAQVSFDPRKKNEMYHSNIQGTKNLLRAIKEYPLQKFCFVSSIAVLDGVNNIGEVDEGCYFNPSLEHSHYAISKHYSELEVWESAAEGLNVVVVNPGVIVGSGNWKQSSGTLFSSLNQMPFSFSGGTGYVDVRDVAKISIELMDKNLFQERFVLVSENKTYQEVANFVREKLGKSTVKIIPNYVLKLVYGIRILFGWLFPSLQIITKSNLEALCENTPISNQKIKNTLAYSFIPLNDSLAFHLKHYILNKTNT